MRGLETISTTRQSGRGPDSSLIRAWIFMCTFYCLTDSHSMSSEFTEIQGLKRRLLRDPSHNQPRPQSHSVPVVIRKKAGLLRTRSRNCELPGTRSKTSVGPNPKGRLSWMCTLLAFGSLRFQSPKVHAGRYAGAIARRVLLHFPKVPPMAMTTAISPDTCTALQKLDTPAALSSSAVGPLRPLPRGFFWPG